MELTLWVFGGIAAGELVLYSQPFWRFRRFIAPFLLIGISSVSGYIFFTQVSWLSALLLLLSLYRVVNLLRIVEAKMHANYLHRVTWRSSLWLLGLQLLCLLVWPFWSNALLVRWLPYYVISECLVALSLFWTTVLQLRRLKPPTIVNYVADRDLPSISICIPARNETLNLEDCLLSVLATNYPKLEVLVLDDASHDRTPDIIKSFAHDGVRFIKGDKPPGAWLAKNWAYQRLYTEASGKYVLFCGVDARFEPTTFKAMIQVAVQQNSQMISFVPRNTQAKGWRQELSILLQPVRYAWELCLPRASFGRPPVLSTSWLVERKFMKQYGGFAAVSRMVTPESYFARQADQQQGYAFLKSTPEMNLTTQKSVGDQWDTAVRNRYPQLHKRPEFVLLLSLIQLKFLLLPFVIFIYGLGTDKWSLAVVSGLTIAALVITYSLVTTLTYGRFQWRSLITFPFAVLFDISTRHYSLWRYEFGEVIWKGRDVTAPVMHVIPHLPPLE